MSLTGRFTALFLGALALALVGFSLALYLAARFYLHRQVEERLEAALAVLVAAAEVIPHAVEWEPHERVLPLGQDAGDDQLRWMVFDDRGRLVDHSRNLDEAELTPGWQPRWSGAGLPPELTDRSGRAWRVAQRRILPSATPSSGSMAASGSRDPMASSHGLSKDSDLPAGFYDALTFTACAPLGPIESSLATLGWALFALTGASWGIAALLCRRLSRRALTPLTRMVESARGLDAAEPGWCLETAGTGDELDDLGRAFNDLLSRLHLAYERQRRFSGDASHQLRTPLTVLIGQIEVALRQDRPGEEYRRVLKAALGRAVHLSRIVEALLFLGRAEGETQLPDLETIDLGRWVADHLADHAAAVQVAHHAIEGDGPRIRAHPSLLGQLLDNLLDNAAKYGGPGATVVVRTLREDGTAILAIEDSGPGIAPEDLPRVFEPFYRSAQARRQGLPGIGLGLAVVHRIALAFGGTVGVRKRAGGGCCIEVRLPQAVPIGGSAIAPSTVESAR